MFHHSHFCFITHFLRYSFKYQVHSFNSLTKRHRETISSHHCCLSPNLKLSLIVLKTFTTSDMSLKSSQPGTPELFARGLALGLILLQLATVADAGRISRGVGGQPVARYIDANDVDASSIKQQMADFNRLIDDDEADPDRLEDPTCNGEAQNAADGTPCPLPTTFRTTATTLSSTTETSTRTSTGEAIVTPMVYATKGPAKKTSKSKTSADPTKTPKPGKKPGKTISEIMDERIRKGWRGSMEAFEESF